MRETVKFIAKELEQLNAQRAKYELEIANLEPYEKVLVRNYDSESWNVTFFVEAEEIDINPMKTVTIVKTILSSWFQCIPCNFETEELIGTNKDCPDFYKWWENN